MARAFFRRQKASSELSESSLLPRRSRDNSLDVRAVSKLCVVPIGDPSRELCPG